MTFLLGVSICTHPPRNVSNLSYCTSEIYYLTSIGNYRDSIHINHSNYIKIDYLNKYDLTLFTYPQCCLQAILFRLNIERLTGKGLGENYKNTNHFKMDLPTL